MTWDLRTGSSSGLSCQSYEKESWDSFVPRVLDVSLLDSLKKKKTTEIKKSVKSFQVNGNLTVYKFLIMRNTLSGHSLHIESANKYRNENSTVCVSSQVNRTFFHTDDRDKTYPS